jgi:hypothetical protein
MRQGSNSGRRPRGRTNRKQHGGGGGGQSRTHTFDSNGPDGRVRGNARQVYEKYLTLARDATSAGDRIAAEAYFQHAEHYFRILNDSTDPQSAGRRQEERQSQAYNGNAAESGDGESAGGDSSAAAEEKTKANGAAAAKAEQPADVSQPGAEQPQVDTVPAESNGQDAAAEAPQKPRRGRPRKPRASNEDGQGRKQESSPESESDSAVP